MHWIDNNSTITHTTILQPLQGHPVLTAPQLRTGGFWSKQSFTAGIFLLIVASTFILGRRH